MLIVSRKAALAAIASGDDAALGRAVELAIKVLTHPKAGPFFNALTAAIRQEIDDAEMMGNDPEVLNNDGAPVDPQIPDETYDDDSADPVDEDSDASNPADEGLVDHDHVEDQPEEEQDAGAPNLQATSGIATFVADTERVARRAITNFRRFT
jgi:hypothetical protein